MATKTRRRKTTELHLVQPKPGYGCICVNCIHRVPEMVRIGHTNPCDQVGWDGPKRLYPKLVKSADGVEACNQHRAKP